MDNTQLYNTSTNDSVTDATKGTAIMVLESCILVFLDVAAIFGNSLVCAAFYRNPSLRQSYKLLRVLTGPHRFVHGCFGDAALSAIATMANRWVAGDFGCKIHFILW